MSAPKTGQTLVEMIDEAMLSKDRERAAVAKLLKDAVLASSSSTYKLAFIDALGWALVNPDQFAALLRSAYISATEGRVGYEAWDIIGELAQDAMKVFMDSYGGDFEKWDEDQDTAEKIAAVRIRRPSRLDPTVPRKKSEGQEAMN